MIDSILLQTQTAGPAIHGSARAFGAVVPYGIVMAMIAMGVLFAALLLLYLAFSNVARLFGRESRKKPESGKKKGSMEEDEIPGEVNAAIALALHLYRSQLHDNEDPIITMKRVARTYSPWSSKIYGLTRAPK